MDNLLERILLELERLIQGNEGNVLIFSLVIIAISIQYLYLVKSYVDPYEKAKKELKPGERKNPLVSFFVSVKNEEKEIIDCIESMIKQTYKNHEIFIVDDASSDNTPKILETNFGKHTNINIIYLNKNIGKKKALAKAMQKANGNIFAFTDSDSIWKEDSIEKIVTIFENDKNVGAVSGHCNAKNANQNLWTRMQNSWYEKQYRWRKGFESNFGAVSCVSGPLACYRREAIYNYIPKWENDEFLGKEFRFATDRIMTGFALFGKDIGTDIKEKYLDSPFVKNENYPSKNWKVVYCNSAKVWTSVPTNLSKIISQKIRWNKSFIRNLFFTGKHYWKKSLPVASYYYIHSIFVFIYPFLFATIIVQLVLQEYFLLIITSSLGYILLSVASTFFINTPNKSIFDPVIGTILYHLVFQWLIFYSMLTMKSMNWERENHGEV